MFTLVQEPDPLCAHHLSEARRVLALPPEATGFHWHPFGVYAIELARRVAPDGTSWSRRLHVWHPDVTPVGESSLYGVHTHSGTAVSHVLVGTLDHHLYQFRPDPDGVWLRSSRAGRAREGLEAHVQGPTRAGMMHTLPANQPHGVSKPPGFAISLFEQREEGRAQPFTTWQRQDVPPEALVQHAPLDKKQVWREAIAVVEEAFAVVRP